jgi:preprotein translocase subunit SecB
MKLRPLLLETHFFTKVQVEANPDYQPQEHEPEIEGIETVVELAQHREEPQRWQVKLIIRTAAAKAAKLPYTLELHALGFFRVDPEIEAARQPKLVQANGAAILYSSAREFLLMVTGRGPWPPIYLPTTNFLKPAPAQDNHEEKPKKRKSARSNTLTDTNLQGD